jgi:hypothetical protein
MPSVIPIVLKIPGMSESLAKFSTIATGVVKIHSLVVTELTRRRKPSAPTLTALRDGSRREWFRYSALHVPFIEP